MASPHIQAEWTAERIATLKRLWSEGISGSHIARQLGGVTRNAVHSKVARLGLERRATPSQPKGAVPRPASVARPFQKPHVARLTEIACPSQQPDDPRLAEIMRPLTKEEVYVMWEADLTREFERGARRSVSSQTIPEPPKPQPPHRPKLRNGIDERYYGVSLKDCRHMSSNFQLLIDRAQLTSLGELIETFTKKGMTTGNAARTAVEIYNGNIFGSAGALKKNVEWADNVLRAIRNAQPYLVGPTGAYLNSRPEVR